MAEEEMKGLDAIMIRGMLQMLITEFESNYDENKRYNEGFARMWGGAREVNPKLEPLATSYLIKANYQDLNFRESMELFNELKI